MMNQQQKEQLGTGTTEDRIAALEEQNALQAKQIKWLADMVFEINGGYNG